MERMKKILALVERVSQFVSLAFYSAFVPRVPVRVRRIRR
jgi:hypothetical protein